MTGSKTGLYLGFCLSVFLLLGSLLGTAAAQAAGFVLTNLGPGSSEAHGIALLPDGRFVWAGFTRHGTCEHFSLAQYRADGSPDTSFGTNGRVVTPVRPASDEILALIRQSADGTLYIAGNRNNGSLVEATVAHYVGAGTFANGFGYGGIVETPLGGGLYARALALQNDGNVVAAGYASMSQQYDFAAMRYKPDGSLDPTFGNRGIAVTNFGTPYDQGYSVAIDNAGRILVGGESMGANLDFALARYKPNGALDTSFGTGGKVTTDISGGDERAYGIALDSNRIVLAGYSFNNGHSDFIVVRYLANGTLDPSFGGTGKVATPIDQYAEADAVAVQSDGRIVVAGSANQGGGVRAVRYRANGTLDPTFGTGGIVRLSLGNPKSAALAMAIQPADGKILLAGTATDPGGTEGDADFMVARLNSNGTLDPNFGPAMASHKSRPRHRTSGRTGTRAH